MQKVNAEDTWKNRYFYIAAGAAEDKNKRDEPGNVRAMKCDVSGIHT